ncbi:hypothetical protein B0J13DRAFT_559521 [Dactylonectria estremocensis]|uniref:Zn(2)-C6 fungal-type domain-containing protein n=1 Tax=Dactylonectria estremocensis TaxID=1079267 RepID=A0A9P9J062_9HYPO|nr:hypothetical protein B0J13DRAFT_559521 [Dactylonectria estremocensis]
MQDAPTAKRPSRARTRTENACLPCQSRKKKCDGNGSVCSKCSKRGVLCVYEQRRTRGLGKGKEYVRELEERLQRLEQLLRTQAEDARPSDKSEGNYAIQEGENLGRILLKARRKSPEMTINSNMPPPVVTPPQQVQSFWTTSSTTTSEQSQTTNRPGMMRLPYPPNIPPSYKSDTLNGGDKGPFPMKMFITPHSGAEVLRLFTFAMEEAGETYPLFTPDYVKALTDHVTDSTQDNAEDRPTQLAISSCLAAISMQWKAENSSLATLSQMMWSHFKNAFSTFPYLITKGSSVYSFHALLLMAVFLQGCAEIRVATQITAAAVRVAQMAGIPCRSQGPILAELNLRAFWTLCILDVEMTNKLMILPGIDDRRLPLRLPSCHSPEHMAGSTGDQIRILACQAGLATTRSRIHKHYLIHAHQTNTCSPDIESPDRLEAELELWRQNLPCEIRPFGISQSMPKQLPPSVILLHLQYYHSKCTLFAMRAAARDHEPEYTTSLPGDVVSARAAIRLLSAIPAEQFSCIWRMLVYPLSMVMLLLSDVFRDPKVPSAELSVLAIEEFVNYLKRLKQDLHCDVSIILEGCTKMHDIARCVVFLDHASSDARKGRSNDEELQKIFSSRTNFLPLAQRFMSEMPSFENEGAMGLAKVLGIDWAPDDAYGPFVPDFFKADYCNFGFEFTA